MKVEKNQSWESIIPLASCGSLCHCDWRFLDWTPFPLFGPVGVMCLRPKEKEKKLFGLNSKSRVSTNNQFNSIY